MTPSQRLNAYYAQTGRSDLTPAQRRRHKHKAHRAAIEARGAKTALKVAAAAERKAREAFLTL